MIRRCLIVLMSILMAVPCLGAQREQRKARRVRRVESAATSSAPAGRRGFGDTRGLVYRKVGDVELKLHVCLPAGHKSSDKRPAIIFFFGGGWLGGSAGQFLPQCKYLASRGMVAASADYRVYSRDKAMIADCTSDAQSAVRWLRAHAPELGVDPDRIAVGGGSAGGHLAAAVGTVRDFTGEENAAVSFRPNAMVLFNPAIDLTPDESKPGESAKDRLGILSRMGAQPEELSPMDHIRPGLPPTIIFHGRQDPLIPFAKIEAFAAAMKAAGNRCEVVGFEGQTHGFFNFSRSNGRYFVETLRMADRFLTSLGYLRGEPTIDDQMAERLASQPE